MTTKKNKKRNSLCVVCGKRVSIKTDSGEIRWQPSHVEDEGLFCDECYKKRSGIKSTQKDRS